jgi:hypothetical protein
VTRIDLLSLASGVVVTALGALVLLDSSDALDIPLGWVAVAVTAALGVVVLISGVAGREPERHD